MSPRTQPHQHPRPAHSMPSSTGNAIDSGAASFVTSSSLAPPSHSSSSLATSTTTSLANDRARHFARARRAADQVRLSHLAKGLLSVSPDPPRSNTDSPRADQNLQLLRYTLEVEALDRGKSIQKRISVIFPIQPPAAPQQQPLPNTTLCPRKARNIVRIPPIRHLSLLPPAPKVPRFRSLAPAAAPELRVEPETASADANDARRMAEDLARSTVEVGFAPGPEGRTAAWAHDQQQRLRKRAYPFLNTANNEAPSTSGAASDSGGPFCGNKRARLLCERRGKCVELLNIG